MPETAQVAIRAVLGGDVIEASRPVNEAQVGHFASIPIGAELVSEWGRGAPQKISQVWASVDQMFMRGGDLTAALDWFDTLPPEQAKAVLRGLARGRAPDRA